MFLSEFLLGTGGEADYFVSAYCMTSLYLKKIRVNAVHSQKNEFRLNGRVGAIKLILSQQHFC